MYHSTIQVHSFDLPITLFLFPSPHIFQSLCLPLTLLLPSPLSLSLSLSLLISFPHLLSSSQHTSHSFGSYLFSRLVKSVSCVQAHITVCDENNKICTFCNDVVIVMISLGFQASSFCLTDKIRQLMILTLMLTQCPQLLLKHTVKCVLNYIVFYVVKSACVSHNSKNSAKKKKITQS